MGRISGVSRRIRVLVCLCYCEQAKESFFTWDRRPSTCHLGSLLLFIHIKPITLQALKLIVVNLNQMGNVVPRSGWFSVCFVVAVVLAHHHELNEVLFCVHSVSTHSTLKLTIYWCKVITVCFGTLLVISRHLHAAHARDFELLNCLNDIVFLFAEFWVIAYLLFQKEKSLCTFDLVCLFIKFFVFVADESVGVTCWACVIGMRTAAFVALRGCNLLRSKVRWP